MSSGNNTQAESTVIVLHLARVLAVLGSNTITGEDEVVADERDGVLHIDKPPCN